ncbi:Ldh family oxidoreductase [Mycoplana rhizolycopersici]|uniref:Ldh family oxidoreductase n=1 Tax=Mycoplana rhizolycopersici TaxID=2746702 RepID=A0ABX2QLE1_9HYPH|nr:Ldh family oxidoreductase [Rhizobium rhizolycopersici]NVP57709.1 Ldh family oxidoreductase [Rhizobium rhizolycopersici]
MKLTPERLRGLATALLEARDVPPANARLQADLLLEAELRGLPSHGLQRLPLILSRLDKGLADPRARGTGTWRRRSFLSVEGERGLGPAVMMHALQTMRPVLDETGITIAAIRNANHIGMLAYYAEAAARSGVIGIVMSTSEALVHPFGGTRAMLGTNPLAIGIPSGDKPFILDLATSVVSMGKINNHAMRGVPIPSGWAVDSEGRPTTDPQAAKTGAIAPFGGAKGYGLGLAIELLVATLAGSNLAPDVNGTLDDIHAVNKGDVLILIDASAGDGNARSLAAYLDHLRRSPPSDPASPVAVPGDGARKRRAATERLGIELPQSLLEHLLALEAA